MHQKYCELTNQGAGLQILYGPNQLYGRPEQVFASALDIYRVVNYIGVVAANENGIFVNGTNSIQSIMNPGTPHPWSSEEGEWHVLTEPVPY